MIQHCLSDVINSLMVDRMLIDKIIGRDLLEIGKVGGESTVSFKLGPS